MSFKKNMTRAKRRQDLNRMKRRARRIYPHDAAAKCANHLQPCSCYACGNPRKHFNEKSMQEKRAEIAAAQELSRIRPVQGGMAHQSAT